MEEQIKEITLLLAYLTSWDEKDRLLQQEIKNIITQLKKYYKDWQMITYKKATYISQENKYQRYTYCTKSNAIQPN